MNFVDIGGKEEGGKVTEYVLIENVVIVRGDSNDNGYKEAISNSKNGKVV